MLVADTDPQRLGQPVGALSFQRSLVTFFEKLLGGNPGTGIECRLIVAFPLFHFEFLKGVAESVAGQVRGFDGKASGVGDL